ncbi:hypothetical protein [Tenacibaculum jejuense]|uniref:Lipoprotein n=1 Tax=Tenacibaculum jejuense TaxID=584609 RepID=A0A238UFK5_9FLAO|nr:hypothetical protein [Tenacibaculum jejuense]SNR17766.1 conserved exported protein of unknown function [Tenacibaculum jejuense]
MKSFKFIFILFLAFISCKDNASDLERDQEQLQEMFNEIKALASSKSCTDASEWSFTSYGVKPCGGPWGYIAYPTTIDVSLFLQKVADFNELNTELNKKTGAISDCSLITQPVSVACEDGKAVLIYYTTNNK